MRACNDRTRVNGFKPGFKQGTFRVDIRKKFFYCEGDEALDQVTLRRCGCPTPRPSWVGSEQPGLVKYVCAMAGGLERDDLLGLFKPRPFYDSMIICAS